MAQFEKGKPRPVNSGRKKGSPNKRTIPKVADFLSENGLNPAEEIVKIISDPDLHPKYKLQGWMELMSYTQAKPKEAEDNSEAQTQDIFVKFRDVSNEQLKAMYLNASAKETA